jgi:hypothetical protein
VSTRRDDWLSEQSTSLERLAGSAVVGWRGIEMAFFEDRDGSPVFEDANAPFRQFSCLELNLGAQRNPVIGTYQDDNGWGLWLTDHKASWEGQDGIFRTVHPELPTGTISAVAIHIDERTVAEVLIAIGDRQVLFVAGEAHENQSGGVDLHRFDESVLVFAHPADADRLVWSPARPPRFGLH